MVFSTSGELEGGGTQKAGESRIAGIISRLGWSLNVLEMAVAEAAVKLTNPPVGVGVGVLLLDGSRTKVLIGRRKSSLGHNTFALPGGHLDFGETWEECAAREVMEETGLAIHNVKFAHVVNTVMRDEKRPAHYVTIFMRAELVNSDDRPRNMEPDKCDGWEWAEWPHLPQPVFRPLQTLLESGYNPFT